MSSDHTFKVSLQLAEFANSSSFSPDLSSIDEATTKLKAWNNRPNADSSTVPPFSAIFTVLSQTPSAASGDNTCKQHPTLLARLGNALIKRAKLSMRLLQIGDETSGATTSSSFLLAPDHLQEEINCLKQTFFFMCHLVKATGTWKIDKKVSFGGCG